MRVPRKASLSGCIHEPKRAPRKARRSKKSRAEQAAKDQAAWEAMYAAIEEGALPTFRDFRDSPFRYDTSGHIVGPAPRSMF